MSDAPLPPPPVSPPLSLDEAASLRARYPDHQIIGGGVVPAGYEVWRDGVYQLKGGRNPADPSPSPDAPLPYELRFYRQEVCPFPIWIAGVGTTVPEKRVLFCTEFLDPVGARCQIWCAFHEFADHNTLIKMGGKDLPVGTTSLKNVSQYLTQSAMLNGGATPTPIVIGKRSGPYVTAQGRGWLLGEDWIGPGRVMAHPGEQGRFLRDFRAHGSLERWLEKYREVCQFGWSGGWLPRGIMASGFAVPIMRLFSVRSFFIHHWTTSGQGKTSIGYLRVSIYGDPEKLNASLNMTQISGTELFKHFTDLPVLYDEKQVTTINLAQFIYAVVGQQSRNRGTKGGGLRDDQQNWITIAHTTGETPIVEAGDLGGIQNRVIQLESQPFEHESMAAPIYAFTQEHHGVAGRAYLECLQRHINRWGVESLATRYEQARLDLANAAGLSPDFPHVKHVAVIVVAHALAQHWFFGRDIDAAQQEGHQDGLMMLRETRIRAQKAYAVRVLAWLRDHLFLSRGSYMETITEYGRTSKAQGKMPFQLVGIANEKGMSYIPAAINKELKDAGFDPTRVWRDFAKEGWLVQDSPDSPTTTYCVHDHLSYRHEVYTIRADIFYTDGGARADTAAIIAQAGGQPQPQQSALRLMPPPDPKTGDGK